MRFFNEELILSRRTHLDQLAHKLEEERVPIYAEVVPRELGYVLQDSLDVQVAWYVDDDGGLNMDRLLSAFGTFFGEHWLDHLGDYREAAPQLILQAYLQRVVNGGGRIEREYGLGLTHADHCTA